MIKMNFGITLCLLWLTFLASMSASELKLNYRFDSISSDGTMVVDISGNQYDGALLNGAALRDYGAYRVLDLGDANGYVDLGASFGPVLSGLSDFTISTYLFIDASTRLSDAGNFVWAFGNSNNLAKDANGAYFFSAKSTRYAISTTHWQDEQSVREGNLFPQGKWKHLVYIQDGATGTIYIDGKVVASDDVSVFPTDLGECSYNYIGRSVYSNDVYLKNALYYDFRVYAGALSSSELGALGAELTSLNSSINRELLEQAAAEISVADTLWADVVLPEANGDVQISWTSSNAAVLSSEGEVTRPASGQGAVTLELVAHLLLDEAAYQKRFNVVVLPYPADDVAVINDVAALNVVGDLNNLRSSVELDTRGLDGSVVVWSSSEPSFLSPQGDLLRLSPNGAGKQLVQLVATVSKGSHAQERTFDIYVAEDDGFSAYLFSYFTGNSGDQEAIRFALSYDGYNYIALNSNNPIIASADISSTGGVRDPHILRGADNHFYMVVTDMVSANGWSSNRAMVLLKSSDLIHWTSSVVNIQEKYAGQDDLERVWAPQTIYDAKAGKFMLYWSMKYVGGPDIIYYAYANDDFTDIEGEPQQLFYHPDNKSCIDGDIILKDGVYHLFFKTEGSGNGIKKAVSQDLTSGYQLIDKYYQQTTKAVEGSSVFRMINSDQYILMYDMYSSGQYQFTESVDLDNFTIVDDEVSMNFHPRHGTVIPITDEEAQRLSETWASHDELIVFGAQGANITDDGLMIDNVNRKVSITTQAGGISAYDPQLLVFPGVSVSPSGVQDFSQGPLTYTLMIAGLGAVDYEVELISNVTQNDDFTCIDSHKLYPNPADTFLKVEMEDVLANNRLMVYDITGRQVISTPVLQKTTTINLLELSASPYYMLSMLDDKVLWRELFIVE